MPKAKFVSLVIENQGRKGDGKRPGCWSNTIKLRKYAEFVEKCTDDVVLADCDMLCLGDAKIAFDKEFDIGITVKKENHKSKSKINGGIIFVRNNAKAKAWVKELSRVNDMMYEDDKFHSVWMRKYFGMNQAAMGYMLEMKNNIADVVEFPTVVWNNCDCDWGDISEDTVFVHIKSDLRDAVFSRKGYKNHEKAMRLYYEYTVEKDCVIEEYNYNERRREQRKPGRKRKFSKVNLSNPEARTRDRLRRVIA
jgi:hypothetical protein